jgi:hypothetical protein
MEIAVKRSIGQDYVSVMFGIATTNAQLVVLHGLALLVIHLEIVSADLEPGMIIIIAVHVVC